MSDSAVTQVPVFDLKRQTQALKPELMAALESVVDGCGFSLGPQVKAFEEEFAAATGAAHVIGVDSGTSALHLALLALGVGPGDEVIVPALTFIATAWAPTYVGATPVFCDVDPVTLCMSPESVASAITDKTKAVICVHLYGQSADLTGLNAVCQEKGVPLIEDAAQAQGALFEDRHVGIDGVMGCFSFYPTKNLGALGDAGALTTNDEALAAELRTLRDHSQKVKYQHHAVGFNYRMAGFQGAVLSVKLRHLGGFNDRRREIAAAYHAGLSGVSELTLPTEVAGRHHVYHQFVCRHPRREALTTALRERGVGTGLHYPRPLHRQPVYEPLGYGVGSFPVSETAADEVFSLPMFPELRDEEVAYVVETVRAVASEV